MPDPQLHESARRSLHLICRQGGHTGSLIIPSADLATLTAAGLLKEVVDGWAVTQRGYAFDQAPG